MVAGVRELVWLFVQPPPKPSSVSHRPSSWKQPVSQSVPECWEEDRTNVERGMLTLEWVDVEWGDIELHTMDAKTKVETDE